MVHGKTYSDPTTGRFLKPEEVNLSDSSNPKVVATGETALVSFEKMSKSKHNGVDPTDFISQYGADATRAHMLFQAPVSEILDWDEAKIAGVTRWLNRLYDLVQGLQPTGASSKATTTAQAYFESSAKRLDSMSQEELTQWDADCAIWRDVQKNVASVTLSYEKVYTLNTVVSDLMSLTNTITANTGANAHVQREAVSTLLRMLAPITPAFAEECWSILEPESQSLFQSASFPVVDGTRDILEPRKQICAVQVNGKLRFAVEIPKPCGLSGDQLREWLVEEILKTDEAKAKLSKGAVNVRSAKKVIVIKDGKLVNFVL
jgi:leucyl-tRNA synthetase